MHRNALRSAERQRRNWNYSGQAGSFPATSWSASSISSASDKLSCQCLGNEVDWGQRLIAPCAAGSLQKHVAPGHFVVCDQFVDRTSGRIGTFYDGPIATHVSSAEPYCGELRDLAIEAGKKSGITTHAKGTVVVIQGPRFSSKAESKWFLSQGWEVINMTQFPEVHLAKELEMCVVNISLITDYDAGLIGDIEPVSHSEVVKVFTENLSKLRALLASLIVSIPAKRDLCNCAETLKHARA